MPTAAARNRSSKVQLDDLSPGDRQRLAAELAAEQQDTLAESMEAASHRDAAIRKHLDDRDHMKGCPADGRIEAYAAVKPARPDQGEPARHVTVIRCIECGGTTIEDMPYVEFVAGLDPDD